MSRPRYRRGLVPATWSTLDQALVVIALTLVGCLLAIGVFRLLGVA